MSVLFPQSYFDMLNSLQEQASFTINMVKYFT